MALSVSQLKTPPTREETTAWLLERARELGFQTTGWQEGRIQNTILNVIATGITFCAQLSADTVRNIYSEEASGAGLTLLSKNSFDNTRESAAKAAGEFLMTNGGTVAHVVTVGQLLIEDVNGVQFSNTEADTIPAGGSISLDFEATLAGASGNIANNATLTLVTPLAGVTVTNPGPGDVDLDGLDDPWYNIRTGADPETDIELRQRNATKWGTLSTEKTATAVENLALKQQGVSKVKVIHDNPRGHGTVDVYVASGGSLVSLGDKTLAQAAFADATFGTDSAYPPGDVGTFPTAYYIKDPGTLELQVVGVVFYDPQYAQTEVEANLTTSLNDFVALLPIGGVEYVSGSGEVTLGDLLEVMENTTGVRSVKLTTPTGDTSIAPTTLVQAPADWITGRLTFTAVTS